MKAEKEYKEWREHVNLRSIEFGIDIPDNERFWKDMFEKGYSPGEAVNESVITDFTAY